jgi:pilus assembly protein CpaC
MFWHRWFAFLLGCATMASVLAAGPTEAHAQAPDKEFTIAVGETLTFNARGVNRVAIGLSSIADVKPTSDNRQLILTAKSAGVTTVNIFSDRGQKTLLIRVVGVNPESLAAEVREVLGDRSGVDVRVVKGRVLLEGEVASEVFKKKIEKLVALYPNQVLNFTTFREAFVEGARMVAVDLYFVQMAEIDRDRLGIGWGQFFGANYTFGAGDVPLYYGQGAIQQVGQAQGPIGPGILPGERNPARFGAPIALTGGNGQAYFSVVGSITAALDFMASYGLIKEIKRGIIVTETGTEGRYHSGGTLLIEVQGFNDAAVVEKPYGLEVAVTPVLDFENRVKLTIEVDVSELDFANGVGELPAFRNSTVEAIVNMQEGQSVLVSTQQSTLDTETWEGIAYLAKIPILGALFAARNFLGNTLNNAVFVTPRVYEPGGKLHKTLINGAFERLLDAGAEPEDLPDLTDAQAPAPAPAAAPAPAPAADSGGDNELLEE